MDDRNKFLARNLLSGIWRWDFGHMPFHTWATNDATKAEEQPTPEEPTPAQNPPPSDGLKELHELIVQQQRWEAVLIKIAGNYMARNQELEDKLESQHVQYVALKSDYTFSRADLYNMRVRMQQTMEEVQQTRGKLQQAKEEVQQMQEEVQQTHAELQQTHAEMQQTQAELQQTQAELQQTQAELQQAQEDLEDRHADIQALQQLVRQFNAEKERVWAENRALQRQLAWNDHFLEQEARLPAIRPAPFRRFDRLQSTHTPNHVRVGRPPARPMWGGQQLGRAGRAPRASVAVVRC